MSQDPRSYVNSLSINNLPFGGITDQEGAKAVARKLFESYDKDRNGVLDKFEVGPMMVDAYKSINKGFNPSAADLETYLRVLDKDNDGRVTYQDIEAIAMKYLVGGVGFQSIGQNTVNRNVNSSKTEIAKNVFGRFAKEDLIDLNSVQDALKDAFGKLGVGYTPTAEDINTYLRTYGTQVQGRLNFKEFEDLFQSVSRRIGA